MTDNRRTSAYTTPPQHPALFAATYYEPVNPTTQVDRLPGTPDAPCHCNEHVCRWPFNPDCWNRETDGEQCQEQR